MSDDFELQGEPAERPHSIGARMAGGNGGRQEADFYPTPAPVTQALIDTGLIPRGPRIWEPACGDGAMCKVLHRNGYSGFGTDLHERGMGNSGVDFLRTQKCFGPIVITNPPFMLAKEFILRAGRWKEITWMALLLKANYWAAAERLQLFECYTPRWWLPLTWRVDFLNLGRPTMDVAWCIWDWRGPAEERVHQECEMRLLRRPGEPAAMAELFKEGEGQ